MDEELIERIRFESSEMSHLNTNSELSIQIEVAKNTLLANSLKVSETTVPIIKNHIADCSSVLGMDESNIDCYIYAKPDHNAFSISQGANNVLLAISSSLIKILDHAEMKFLIGHELGHSLFSHSELTHLGHSQMDYQSSKSLREMEISADRIGYLCAGSLENSITAMMKIASGLDGQFLNQDIRPFLDQSVSVSSQLANLPFSKSTHPPLPLRARALVWISTINRPSSEISNITPSDFSQINGHIRSEISSFFDETLEFEFQRECNFFKLLLYSSHLSKDGVLTKKDQEAITKECGKEDSNKLFLLMSDLSKTQVETLLVSKLRTSFKKMVLYSVNESHVFVQEYKNKFGISDQYIKLVTQN